MSDGHHISPKSLLYKVFGALLFLTLLTYITAEYVDIGPLNLPLALLIASTKAALVVLFFMALKYDNRVNALVFSAGIFFLAIFIGITMLDTEFRDAFDPAGNITIQEIEQTEAELRAMEATLDSTQLTPQAFVVPVDSSAFQ